MGKKKIQAESSDTLEPVVEKLTVETALQNLYERIGRWQHFTNHDAFEARKELDFISSKIKK